MKNDPRLAFRSFMGALLTLILFIGNWLAPSAPAELWSLFSGVWLAGVGMAEVWYDHMERSNGS